MTNGEVSDVREREFRQRWHKAHISRFNETVDQSDISWRERRITPHAPESRAFLDALSRSRDLSTFQADTDRWVRNFESGYSGTAGQMIINQINKMSPDPDSAVTVLLDALSTPHDRADAIRKIRLLAEYLQEIRVGAHPSPKRAPFVASYYWGLDDPTMWPVAWPKSTEYMSFVTGISDFDDQGERYDELYRCATELDGDPLRFEQVAAWWADERPVFVDEVLCDRAALRVGAKDRGDDPERYRENASALVAVAQHIGTALERSVAEAAGRTLKAHKPGVMWDAVWPRGDLWADWRVPGTYGLAVRIWLNANGLAMGLRPYPDADSGSTDRAVSVIENQPLPGYEILAGRMSRVGRDVGFTGGGSGELIYARWFDRGALASLDLPSEILRTARDVAGLMAELNGDTITATAEDDGLATMVKEFKTTTEYPTPRHEQDQASRRDFAKMLDPEELSIVDRADLRLIWNTQRYGGTGPMSVLNTSIRDADEAEYQRIINTFTYLCWGDDPPATRINRALEDPALHVKGFGESVMMKMLAITHPEQFITAYPYTGPKGKLRMLKLLGIAVPDVTGRGELQVASNNALRARLDRFFPGDPLGMGEFLYWFVERDDEPPEPPVDPLDDLAEELLVDRAFLDDVVALLKDKRQVVFYGPPGTGKTYFARKLAEALVPDAARRPVVQFHPSTSYEDFFEGYRPETNADGLMSYRLQRGPLAELAARATDAPGRRHLMIIDEINRANLPKVLGELLFLFEYRDTPVRTLYRPDDPFELSKDIWFIGTMNTADRSIALVDAALRRRFHFVPFFPNHGPIAGLLARWLEREGEPAWVGEVVAQVNDELARELGGPHLQLGASHFMKHGIDRAVLQRIWAYDIEPFIEDQFFGDAQRIDYFRFDQVWERFNYLAGESVSENSGGDEPGN
ncbi:UNVERIFIED_CONTAM: 5-methylcytosine-specific restriction protein B [Williamsia faeni]